MKNTGECRGVIDLEVEVTKSLSRARLIHLALRWGDMLRLPLSDDIVTVGRFELKIVRGPASDEMLLNSPTAAVDPSCAPIRWYARYDSTWARAEELAAAFSADHRYLSAEVLR